MSKWEMVRLGDVATYVNGYAFKPSDWGDEGLPIIRIQNLTGSAYETNCFNGEYNVKYLVEDGDVLISWSASLGVYQWNKGKALLNQHIFKVIFDKINIDKSYFVFAVNKLLSEMGNQTHGSTMKHITKPRFDNTLFPLPPLDEQKKIATELDKISDLIAKRKQQIEKLDVLVKAKFIEMFGDPVTNPMGWETPQLNLLGELNRGMSKHRPRNDPALLGGAYPLIQTGEVANAGLYIVDYKNTYSELGLKQSKLWKENTLCITIAANIAKTAILGFDACFPDSVVGFVASDKTNQIFIHYWFSFFQQILESQAPESAQKNINLKILSELQIICPPIDLQTQFATYVQQVEQNKQTLEQALAQLELLYKQRMQYYFE